MKTLILGLGLTFAIGCTGVEPIGPFKDKMGGFSTEKKKSKPKIEEGPPPPVAVPAVKPTPPLNLIYPDEVMAENPQAAAQRLMNELEADRKSMTPPPMTAEVSRYKGGVKQ